MNGIRCLHCGTLLFSDDRLEKLGGRMASGNPMMAKCTIECPKCKRRLGFILACDPSGLVILLLPPEKTKRRFNELREMLEGGLTIATIAAIVNNAKKPQYISFLQ
jgi:phage FluMu protein Com